jgi:hypothetical protein
MTRDEMLALEGEELDNLVAEKVMGWHIESTPEWSNPHWVDADGHYAAGISVKGPWYEDSEDIHILNWHPLGSMLWAEQVMEKLARTPKASWYIETTYYADDKLMYWVMYEPDGDANFEYIYESESLTDAICRVALMTAMDK